MPLSYTRLTADGTTDVFTFATPYTLPPISLFICSDNNLKTQMRGDEVLVR